MKIVRRDYVRNGPGSVKMVPDESDDLWIAYSLISECDSVFATTVRKVLREAASGGRDAERVKLKLEIRVEAVEYDKEGAVLRIHGKNVSENEHVKDVWDTLALDMLHQGADPAASADLAVILMQEGLSRIFLVGRSILSLWDPSVLNPFVGTLKQESVTGALTEFEQALMGTSMSCSNCKAHKLTQALNDPMFT